MLNDDREQEILIATIIRRNKRNSMIDVMWFVQQPSVCYGVKERCNMTHITMVMGVIESIVLKYNPL